MSLALISEADIPMFPVVYAMNTNELTTDRLVRPTQLEEISAQAENKGMTKVTVIK